MKRQKKFPKNRTQFLSVQIAGLLIGGGYMHTEYADLCFARYISCQLIPCEMRLQSNDVQNPELSNLAVIRRNELQGDLYHFSFFGNQIVRRNV